MDGALNVPGSTGPWPVATRLADLHDTRRARTLPVKLYLPATPRPRGLILFSHGLGGSREGGAAWLEHWASQGFLLLALQHPGSDCCILRNNSPQALRSAFKAAMNPQELTARIDDFRFVLGRIGRDPALPDAINAAARLGPTCIPRYRTYDFPHLRHFLCESFMSNAAACAAWRWPRAKCAGARNASAQARSRLLATRC